MQVEIQDSQVKGIVVVLKDDDGTSPWYMRLTSPGIEASAEDMAAYQEHFQ